MLKTVVMWLVLGNACHGLVITYDGYISRVRTEMRSFDGTYVRKVDSNGIVVGDPARMVFTIGEYRDWKPGEVHRCNYCSEYIFETLDAVGTAWHDGTKRLEWILDYLDRTRSLVVSDVSVPISDDNNVTMRDWLGFEGFPVISKWYMYSVNNEAKFIGAISANPGIRQEANWLSGNRITDVPTGSLVLFSEQRPYQLTVDRFMDHTMTSTYITVVHDNLLPGDANVDGVFDQLDIVQVLSAGRYFGGYGVPWSQGDWNADGLFDHRDIILAHKTGYEAGGLAAVSVPEPSTWLMAICAAIVLLGFWMIANGRID